MSIVKRHISGYSRESGCFHSI